MTERGMKLSRRQFIKTAGMAGVSATVVGKYSLSHGSQGTDDAQVVPKRTFGKTGEQVSILSLGGIIDFRQNQLLLNQALRKLGRYDFVFCGRQAIDGDTAQVGPQLAEKLGLAQVTYFERILELRDRTIRVRRNVGNG